MAAMSRTSLRAASSKASSRVMSAVDPAGSLPAGVSAWSSQRLQHDGQGEDGYGQAQDG
jgi:hypothetical protein